jgi:hypothetical protein
LGSSVKKLSYRLDTKFQENGKLDDPVEEMIRISNYPVLIPRISFGKHNGMLFSEIPRDYLEWLLTTELDEDMACTVKTYLWLIAVNRLGK